MLKEEKIKMVKGTYDFSGWATRFNIRCSDGRTIKSEAFKHQDGQRVPLVWNHDHNDVGNVLGYAILEHRDEGEYAYGSFNDTPAGKDAKMLVEHGDIKSLSIYANKLKQNNNDVVHGFIREVSLVLAGANPGACIETVIAHSDTTDEEAMIYNDGAPIELYHEEEHETENEENKEAQTVENEEKTETQNENENIEHAEREETVADVFNTLTEKQKTVVYALIGQALQEKENKSKEDDTKMKHNAFENENTENTENTLTHDDIVATIKEAKSKGSLRETFEARGYDNNTLAHSITNVGNLFPDYKNVGAPKTVDRDQTWVGKVMSSIKHVPFSRIRSMYFNITADEARAKGYVKGNEKAEEVVVALKRTTDPQTVYKLQKLDRDDILDITDFDIVAWIKQEMRGKLDEELARAYLIGDGRSSASDDKISADHIRPILGDNSVYTIAKTLTPTESDDEYTFAKKFIKDAIRARKEYKGAGNPTLYCTEDLLTDMLLIEDTNGRVIYDTQDKLATALRVKEIVTVPVMENIVRTAEGYDYTLMGIIVNLADYNVGADKGGAVNMFDDFDINFNKYEYLIETRCSGALVTPYSAISFEKKTTHSEG